MKSISLLLICNYLYSLHRLYHLPSSPPTSLSFFSFNLNLHIRNHLYHPNPLFLFSFFFFYWLGVFLLSASLSFVLIFPRFQIQLSNEIQSVRKFQLEKLFSFFSYFSFDSIFKKIFFSISNSEGFKQHQQSILKFFSFYFFHLHQFIVQKMR